MKATIFGGLLVAALAVTSIAQAQTRTPVINARERHQEHRINQGVRSGELTHGEASRLRANENYIAREKRMDKSKGYVTHGERKQLRHDENLNSHAIRRAKHNDRVHM